MENPPKNETGPSEAQKKCEEKILIIKKIMLELTDLPIETIEQNMEEIAHFVENLERKYPNARKHLLLHAMIGSTMDPKDQNIIYEDFPDEDSIEAFVYGLAREHLK